MAIQMSRNCTYCFFFCLFVCLFVFSYILGQFAVGNWNDNIDNKKIKPFRSWSSEDSRKTKCPQNSERSVINVKFACPILTLA